MKKLIAISLLVLILITTTAACAGSAPSRGPVQGGTSSSGYYDGEKGGMPPPATTTAAQAPAYPAPSATKYPSAEDSNYVHAEPAPSAIPEERMVVRTGNMQMVVDDISAAMDNITGMATSLGGYIVNSQRWKEGERNIGSISIRVRAENYDKAMSDLRALAKSVTNESTSSQDVTEEYVDLDSRVKNLQATETQLQKIMESATKTEEVLSIQRELTNVRYEIERAKGRMQYLERTTATSLITIRLDEAVLALKFNAGKTTAGTDETILFTSEVIGGFAPYSYQWDFGDGNTSTDKSPSHTYKEAGTYYVSLKVTDDKGYTNTLERSGYIRVTESWKPASVVTNAWNGFMAFGRVLVNILIWLGIFSPVWIIIGGIIWWSIYRKRKIKKARAAKSQTAEASAE
jgi:hypothetical protein